MENKTPKIALGVSNVARELNVDEWRVRRLYEKGLLSEPQRVGKTRLIYSEDLPKIEAALRDAGWLPENDNDAQPERLSRRSQRRKEDAAIRKITTQLPSGVRCIWDAAHILSAHIDGNKSLFDALNSRLTREFGVSITVVRPWIEMPAKSTMTDSEQPALQEPTVVQGGTSDGPDES